MTPLTLAEAGRAGFAAIAVAGDADLPVTRLTRAQAATLAAEVGGRLPTSEEWEWMAGRGVRRYPWGETEPLRRHANLRDLGPGRITTVGDFPLGATPEGLLDVAGNVWEWTASSAPGGGAVIRGGSYNSIALYARCAFSNEVPADLSSPGIGLRVVRQP